MLKTLARTIAILVTAIVAVVLVGAPGAVENPFVAVALDGPHAAVVAQPTLYTGKVTAGMHAGEVSARVVGVPLQEVQLLLDGEPIGQVTTKSNGAYAVPVIIPTAGEHRLEAALFLGAPLESRSAPIEIEAATGHLPRRTSQALISSALAQGSIDYPTSLLYRAFALFGDPRLPEELLGVGSEDEDLALFEESRESWSALPPDIQAQLGRFLVRPNDPRSVYSPQAEAQIVDAGSLRAAASLPTPCAKGWTSLPGTCGRTPCFRVWACQTGTYTVDMTAVVLLLNDLWPKMVQLMGPPLQDPEYADRNVNPDGNIDFYLLDPLQVAPRDNQRLTAGIAAAVASDFERSNASGKPVASSGFVLLSRDRLGDPDAFKSDLVHEFFHVLQFAHNYEIVSRGDTINWFVEASATWAEWQFAPETTDTQVHPRFVNSFQKRPELSLQSTGPVGSAESWHSYASYIWPFFAQQEAGSSPQPIADAWWAIEDVAKGDWDGLLRAVDRAGPGFESFFRDFAVRNLNLSKIRKEDGEPLFPLYVEQDLNFPADVPPKSSETKLSGPVTLTLPVKMQSLAAQYDHFEIGNVRHIKFDFSGMASGVDVDAIVKIRNHGWLRIQPRAALSFCRDHVDAEEIYIVLSNHQLGAADEVDATYEVEAKEACVDLAGVIGWNHVREDTFFNKRTEHKLTLNVRLKLSPLGHAPGREDFDNADSTWEETATHQMSYVDDYGCRYEQYGAGQRSGTFSTRGEDYDLGFIEMSTDWDTRETIPPAGSTSSLRQYRPYWSVMVTQTVSGPSHCPSGTSTGEMYEPWLGGSLLCPFYTEIFGGGLRGSVRVQDEKRIYDFTCRDSHSQSGEVIDTISVTGALTEE